MAMELNKWIESQQDLNRRRKIIDGENYVVEENEEGTQLHIDLRNNVEQSSEDTSNDPILCKVTGGSGTNYAVDFYENGPLESSTGSGYVLVVNVHIFDVIPVNSWIVASPATTTVIQGG